MGWAAGAEWAFDADTDEYYEQDREKRMMEQAKQDMYLDAIYKFYDNKDVTWSAAEAMARIWAAAFSSADDADAIIVANSLNLDWIDVFAIQHDDKNLEEELKEQATRCTKWYTKLYNL